MPALDVPAGLERVKEVLPKLHEAGLFTGAALIAHEGEILLSKAWGLADRAKNVPNTPQTIFRIGELSMQFTAAAVLLLEQEGKLGMQDSICTYLDDCPTAWQPITIHHLLSHTSGIPDYLDMTGGYKITQTGATPQQIVTLFREQPLRFQPGAQRVYSRSGFVLAGLIIERVTQQAYGDFMQQHIFAPLGMTQSGYGDPPAGLAPGYSTASSQDPAAFAISALYAAGGCYSTAEDLYRWNEGLYNGQLLNQAQLQKMLTPHATFGDSANLGSGYGIVRFEFAQRQAAGNGGGPEGYSSSLRRYLDDHITTLLIGNQTMEIFALSDQMDKSFFGAE
jgi:CubicO group peptidase (beta-lactamase class C family)